MERFWSKVRRGTDEQCWEWTAARVRDGYGLFRLGKKQVRAHRFAYEQMVGSIPDGLQLDHLCRNRACVNPAHLEPVTCRVNLLRGETAAAAAVRQTHCKQGHPLSGENLIVRPDGRRNCRACRNTTQNVAAARKRVARGAVPGKGGHNATKTHCPAGHPYDEVNTYRTPGGARRCRICRDATKRS